MMLKAPNGKQRWDWESKAVHSKTHGLQSADADGLRISTPHLCRLLVLMEAL